MTPVPPQLGLHLVSAIPVTCEQYEVAIPVSAIPVSVKGPDMCTSLSSFGSCHKTNVAWAEYLSTAVLL